MVPGRVFPLTAQDVKATSEVIHSTPYISSFLAKVLIDLGATHSFTSHRFASKLKVEPVRLDVMLMVSMPTSNIMHIDVMYRPCKVEIAGKELGVNLILLDIKDFDVILGMD